MSERRVFDLALWAFLAIAVAMVPVLLRVTAPYGRHGASGWGPRIPGRVGWIAMELPSAIAMAVFFAVGEHRGAGDLVLLALWQAHYLHRALVYPFRLRDPKPMPIAIAGSGALFNVINGWLNGRWLFHFGPSLTAAWLRDPRALVGIALFVCGVLVNRHSDHVLRSLRAGGETGYKVPRGGLYRWVSCPNYLGEIVEWTGWAIATWSLAGLAFALWTAANLVPRALAHHRWYREKFADYPRERRALVPYLL